MEGLIEFFLIIVPVSVVFMTRESDHDDGDESEI